MKLKNILDGILGEIGRTLAQVDLEKIVDFQNAISRADRIFVAGAGRSLLMIRSLAMRLMQSGEEVYVVGETTTPAIRPGDLMIIASGSGETSTLTVLAKKCKEIGADLALITVESRSTIGKMADFVLVIPASATKRERHDDSSVQLGANTFEQSLLLLGDAITIERMEKLHDANQLLMQNHANLE